MLESQVVESDLVILSEDVDKVYDRVTRSLNILSWFLDLSHHGDLCYQAITLSTEETIEILEDG